MPRLKLSLCYVEERKEAHSQNWGGYLALSKRTLILMRNGLLRKRVSLNFINFRHNKYIDMAGKGMISPEKRPPTERAAYFHDLRPHYQIMLWSLMVGFELDAIEWLEITWRSYHTCYDWQRCCTRSTDKGY